MLQYIKNRTKNWGGVGCESSARSRCTKLTQFLPGVIKGLISSGSFLKSPIAASGIAQFATENIKAF